MSARWRRVLGRAGLALAATLLALGAAEGIHRARLAAADAPGSDDDWYVRYRRMNETLYRASPDPELIYEPVPGASIEMEYGRAAFNSAGMRDDREPSRDPGDRVRVALLGDSLVWSEFLPLHSSLPMRTEHALGERFEVLGFGVTGYDTTQEAAWYERAIRPYQPRIVVVVWCMNDLMIMSGPFERFARGEDRARKDAQDAHFERVAPLRRETLDAVLAEREARSSVRLLARALAAWERSRFEAQYVDEYLIAFEDPARRARAAAALARLGAAIRADGAIPILVVSPILERWERYRWPRIHAFVRDEAERAGFVVHDPLETWRGEHAPELLRIGGDNLHYGERGSAIFGETIARAVREAAQ